MIILHYSPAHQCKQWAWLLHIKCQGKSRQSCYVENAVQCIRTAECSTILYLKINRKVYFIFFLYKFVKKCKHKQKQERRIYNNRHAPTKPTVRKICKFRPNNTSVVLSHLRIITDIQLHYLSKPIIKRSTYKPNSCCCCASLRSCEHPVTTYNTVRTSKVV